MTARHWLVIAAISVIVLAIRLWPSSESKPPVDPPAATTSPSPGSRSRVEPTLAPRPPRPGITRTVTSTFDAGKQHTADPCTTPGDPTIPAGFESVTAQGITVAWLPGEPASPGPTHVAPSPIAIAHLVGGLLEEAAQLTGTARRTELTVFLYRTADEFRSATRAPAWAGGLYDGTAVRVFPHPTEDLGVSLSTLRHETMHAQLHAAIGCMPFWLNEGLAEYAGGPPPLQQWLDLLRNPGAFELRLLRNPALLDRDIEARHMYGVSLAMVLYIIGRGGQPELQVALRTARGAETENPLELWDKLYPQVAYPDVLATLATRLFGMPLEQLGGVIDGPLCCHGLNDINATSCRAATARPTTRMWSEIWADRRMSPRATCRAKW